MLVCSRCGTRLKLKDKYCSVCGLHRKGGKGKIALKGLNISTICKRDNKEPDLLDKLKDHKIWDYYDVKTLANKKIHIELERIRKRIDEIEKDILKTLGRNFPERKFYERDSLEDQLFTIYDYIVLKDKEAIRDKISKYYDLQTLTHEKIDSELKRLRRIIEMVEDTLIYMEKDEPGHPDKMSFYEKRNEVRSQLDVLHDYSELEEMKAMLDNMRDSKLRSIYGRLPDWRLDEKKKTH